MSSLAAQRTYWEAQKAAGLAMASQAVEKLREIDEAEGEMVSSWEIARSSTSAVIATRADLEILWARLEDMRNERDKYRRHLEVYGQLEPEDKPGKPEDAPAPPQETPSGSGETDGGGPPGPPATPGRPDEPGRRSP